MSQLEHSDREPGHIYSNAGPGIFFAIAGIIVMLSTTTAEEFVPGFSVRYQAISTLGGVGYPTEPFWNSLLLLTGILWIVGTTILFRKSKFFLSSICFYLVGIGLVLVSMDPWNVRPSLHGIGAISVALFGAIAAIVSYRFTEGMIKYTSVSLGILSLFALFGNAFVYPILGSGGAERLIYYPIFFWAILFGGVLIGKNHHSDK